MYIPPDKQARRKGSLVTVEFATGVRACTVRDHALATTCKQALVALTAQGTAREAFSTGTAVGGSYCNPPGSYRYGDNETSLSF